MRNKSSVCSVGGGWFDNSILVLPCLNPQRPLGTVTELKGVIVIIINKQDCADHKTHCTTWKISAAECQGFPALLGNAETQQ